MNETLLTTLLSSSEFKCHNNSLCSNIFMTRIIKMSWESNEFLFFHSYTLKEDNIFVIVCVCELICATFLHWWTLVRIRELVARFCHTSQMLSNVCNMPTKSKLLCRSFGIFLMDGTTNVTALALLCMQFSIHDINHWIVISCVSFGWVSHCRIRAFLLSVRIPMFINHDLSLSIVAKAWD